MSELARLVEVPESGLTGTVRGLRELGLLADALGVGLGQ